MTKPSEMTANEMIVALQDGLSNMPTPVGDCPSPGGRVTMFRREELLDLIRRGHVVFMHRDYMTRIIELLKTL